MSDNKLNMDAFINGLSVKNDVRAKSVTVTLAQCLPGAADALATDWAIKSGISPVDVPQGDRNKLALKLGRDTLALLESSRAELVATLSATSVGGTRKGSLGPDDITVTKSGSSVTVRFTVRDDEGGTASVSRSFPLTSVTGAALAVVV